MKKRKIGLWALALALLAGCGGPPAAPSSGCGPEEEDRLVVYTSHKEEVWRPIVQEFEQRTGVWVQVVEGGTNELLERIREEDSTAADVMFGGGVESLESYRDCFTPYVCAGWEEIQPQFREADGVWTPFSALPVVLICNAKLVEPGQLDGWEDLLSPEFRGRIAFTDPGISGSCFTGLVTLMYAQGEEALKRFADNLDGRQLDSSGEVLSSVANGTDLAGVTLEETALKRIAAGDGLAMVYPEEGTSCVPDGSALVRGAPHEENARLFLDFTVSREVQRLLSEQFCRRSVRGDLEPDPRLPDLSDIPMVEYSVEWASRNRESVLMSWAFYLGGEGEP